MESKKAINFDLNNSLLKKYYPSKKYRKEWTEIRNFLIKNGFIHRQYPGYVSKEPISITSVIHLITNMSLHLKWLSECVKEFDLTIVGDEYSMKDYMQVDDFN